MCRQTRRKVMAAFMGMLVDPIFIYNTTNLSNSLFIRFCLRISYNGIVHEEAFVEAKKNKKDSS